MDVLVAFASRHGATREIAEAIGATLDAHGHRAAVRPVDAVLRVDAFDAVVLGSAIYEGGWLPAASSFAIQNAAALVTRPLWVFSSGAIGEGDPTQLLEGWTFPPELATLRDRLTPRDVTIFGGRIEPSYLSLGDWLRNRDLRGKTGDFRDWEAISRWAAGIGTALSALEEDTRTNWTGTP